MALPKTVISSRQLLLLATLLLCLHVSFTLAIRGYVVPHLTPAAHWKYGLQTNSDSQLFHEEAVRLVNVIQSRGWSAAVAAVRVRESLAHTAIIATLYYITGTQSPYVAYAANGLLFVLNGLLFFTLVHRSYLPSTRASFAVAAFLSASPLYLFSHSELLREPFAILGGLLYIIGLLELGSHRTDRSPSPALLIASAIAGAVGFFLLTTLRPYLLIPALLPSLGMLAVLVWPTFVHGRPVRKPTLAVTVSVFAVILFVFVSLQLRTVRKYEASSSLPQAEEPWRDAFVRSAGSSSLSRTTLSAGHVCKLAWRQSPFLPRFVDSKFEALSCAREDFLRFCDQALLGRHADRFCDDVTLMTATDVIRHIPNAIAFGLFTPYPRMWTDDFGTGGTGIRRAGYVIDGAIAYLLLVGLLGLVPIGRSRPDLLVLTVCVIGVVTILGLAIPSQFILARIRLAFYMPLLAFGAIGWLSMLHMFQSGHSSESTWR